MPYYQAHRIKQPHRVSRRYYRPRVSTTRNPEIAAWLIMLFGAALILSSVIAHRMP